MHVMICKQNMARWTPSTYWSPASLLVYSHNPFAYNIALMLCPRGGKNSELFRHRTIKYLVVAVLSADISSLARRLTSSNYSRKSRYRVVSTGRNSIEHQALYVLRTKTKVWPFSNQKYVPNNMLFCDRRAKPKFSRNSSISQPSSVLEEIRSETKKKPCLLPPLWQFAYDLFRDLRRSVCKEKMNSRRMTHGRFFISRDSTPFQTSSNYRKISRLYTMPSRLRILANTLIVLNAVGYILVNSRLASDLTVTS